jgi:hypothetical protein
VHVLVVASQSNQMGWMGPSSFNNPLTSTAGLFETRNQTNWQPAALLGVVRIRRSTLMS